MKKNYQRPLYEKYEFTRRWVSHQKRIHELLTSHTNRLPPSHTIHPNNPQSRQLTKWHTKMRNKKLFQKIMRQETRPFHIEPVSTKLHRQKKHVRQRNRIIDQENHILSTKIAHARSQYAFQDHKQWHNHRQSLLSIRAKSPQPGMHNHAQPHQILSQKNSPNKVLYPARPIQNFSPCLKELEGKEFHIVRKDIGDRSKIMLFSNSENATQSYTMEFTKLELDQLVRTRYDNRFMSFLEAIKFNEHGQLVVGKMREKYGKIRLPWTSTTPSTIRLENIQRMLQKLRGQQNQKIQHYKKQKAKVVNKISLYLDKLDKGQFRKEDEIEESQQSDISGELSLQMQQQGGQRGQAQTSNKTSHFLISDEFMDIQDENEVVD